MKQIEELKKEVSKNISLMKQSKDLGRSYSSISKKNDILKYFISYLETNPSEEYLQAEKIKMQNIISAKESHFNYWSENVCPQDVDITKRRSLFNKEVGITDLKKRIKTLNYILS
jgi:predicted aldo/keto reductase-like oxidoreductase